MTREEALKELGNLDVDYGSRTAEEIDRLDEAIDMAIEALSKPEIVRCKDCKYYIESSEACGLFDTRLQFWVLGKNWTEDSFCYWAEKRDI